MRPVLESIIDKNGGSKVVFTPTPRMVLFAITYAKNQHLIHEEVCEMLGLHVRTIKRWKELYDEPKAEENYFSRWLEEAIDIHAATDDHKKTILEAVGMVNAVNGNFQFWREMARTQGVIKEEPKNTSITINTDFSQIAIGANFDEARRQILRDATGVELPRGTTVAPTLELRQEHKSDGDGTSGLQGIPLEVPNPLDSNGKRAKRSSAVSILPPKDPSRTNH